MMQPSCSQFADSLRIRTFFLPPSSVTRLARFWATCAGILALTAPAIAQQPPPAPGVAPAPGSPPPPPPPPAESSTAPSADPGMTQQPASGPGGAQYDCVPACRAGYVCVQNQCVSACNPACGAGEVCHADGRCVSACNPACPAGQACTGPGVCTATAGAPPGAAPAGAYHPPVAADAEYTAPSEPPVKGKRFHDGFYLRLGVGFGAIMGNAQDAGGTGGTDGETAGLYDEVDVSGVAIPVEVALGGTPAPGFAIGVGSYAVHVPSAKYSAGEGEYEIGERAEYGSISMIGPFFDYYVDPRAGLHVELSPGLVWVTPGTSDRIVGEGLSGRGWGFMLGFGIEGWVSDQWSMGVLARGQFVSTKLEDDSDNEFDFYAFVPSLLLTLTLH
ncbi:MAG TPA: hypothetical protein VI197_23715 [Polyangiaceae bacterium]